METMLNTMIEEPEIMVRPEIMEINETTIEEKREELKKSDPWKSKIESCNIMLNRLHVCISQFDAVYNLAKEYAGKRQILIAEAKMEPGALFLAKRLEDAAYWMGFHSEGLEVQADCECEKILAIRRFYDAQQEIWYNHKLNMWKITTKRSNKRKITKWNNYCERTGMLDQKILNYGREEENRPSEEE